MVDTVQTGTIIGAFPFSFVILLMIANFIRRLHKRNRETPGMERAVNDPINRVVIPDPDGEGFVEPAEEDITVASRPPRDETPPSNGTASSAAFQSGRNPSTGLRPLGTNEQSATSWYAVERRAKIASPLRLTVSDLTHILNATVLR